MTAFTVIDNAPSTGLHSVSANGDKTFSVGEGSSEGWTLYQTKKHGSLQATIMTTASFRNSAPGEATTLIVETSASAIVEGQL